MGVAAETERHYAGCPPACRPGAGLADWLPRQRCRRCAHRRRSRAARTTPRRGCGSTTRRSRRPCSSDAMTGCRHSPGANRRAIPRPPRPGSAATPRPARRVCARPPRDRLPPHPPSPSAAPSSAAGRRRAARNPAAAVLRDRIRGCRGCPCATDPRRNSEPPLPGHAVSAGCWSCSVRDGFRVAQPILRAFSIPEERRMG